jgi:WhiB family redox-sensing transcriptional regulator
MRDSLAVDTVRRALGLPQAAFTTNQVSVLVAVMTRLWETRAACVQVGWEPWFLDRGQTVPRQLKRVCGRCPVRRSCLASAVLVGEEGVWAGTSFEDREAATRRIVTGEPVVQVLDDLLEAARPGRRGPRGGKPRGVGGEVAA